MSELNFSIGFGIQSTICILVGNEIGKGSVLGAKIMKFFVMRACIIIFLIETLCFFLLKQSILELVTDSRQIQQASSPILTMLTLNCFLEFVSMSMIRGLLKAMNKTIAVVKLVAHSDFLQLLFNFILIWLCVGELR